MRELCRLQNVPLPHELDNLQLPTSQLLPTIPTAASNHSKDVEIVEIDSDSDEVEEVDLGDTEPESEADEDLPLEMDEGRSTNKVMFYILNMFCQFLFLDDYVINNCVGFFCI